MFLKTLAIRGFKSFADRAVLDFEPGITVVVGPNGSGKSNVVDAIAWVLGAQAPTAVRSQRMEDVIFAGTAKRTALGRAEVSLTIDNASGYLPVDFSEVTITRTLFRSGDSEYAINGVGCRLLDIQDLLSDAGVGRQQHVIASQGQLDAILNARPEERRAIVEEAAGVLKHRKRRERSERRLAATEANLTRVTDLLREVRRQLRPLERQARAARRAAELTEELTRLRRYLAGREIAELEARLTATQDRRADVLARGAAADAELVAIEVEALAAEAAVREVGTREVSEALARAETVRERARGQAAVLAERRRAVEGELARADDRSALAVLDAELERAHQEERTELAAAAALTTDLEALVADEAALAAERAAVPPEDDGAAGGEPPPGARLADLRRELAGVRAAAEQRQAELRRLAGRHEQLVARVDRLTGEAARLAQGDAGAEADEDDLARAVADAEAARTRADDDLVAAEEARREAEATQRSWQARAEALSQALEQVRSRAGAQRLAGRPGVLGVLLDVVEVDPGWEAAVEAAAGEALGAVVVEGVHAAQAALAALRAGGQAGAVLPAVAAETGPQPSVEERAEPDHAPERGERAGVGQAVAAHVRARRSLPPDQRAAVEQLLTLVVGDARRLHGDWGSAVAAAIAHPDLVLVTADGDRFAPTGWRLGAARARATDALASDARRQAEASGARAREAVEAHGAARVAAEQARRLYQQAVRAADELAARRLAAAGAAERSARELDDARRELVELDEQQAQLAEALARDHARRDDLAARLPGLEAAAADVAARSRARSEALAVLDRRAAELARRRAQLDVRASLAEPRRRALEVRQAELRRALEEAVLAGRERESRKAVLVAEAAVLERLATVVAERLSIVEELAGSLRAERDRRLEEGRQRHRALDAIRERHAATGRRRHDLNEAAQRLEVELTGIAVRLDTAREAVRRELAVADARGAGSDGALDGSGGAAGEGLDGPGVTTAEGPLGTAEAPADAAVARRFHPDTSPTGGAAGNEPVDPPLLPEGEDPAERLRALEDELAALGPVNPLAVDEHAALVERHDFLEEQSADVRASRRELAKVIRAIDDEISATFAAAFADVSDHFTQLFGTLFPGGSGQLRLTDPANLLDTGVEVEARPSGKNVRKLSLLSGGERSLTALGLLFAIFRSRPSPFYVLDEVEAALDDVNLRRFLDLLEEFRPEAQLIVVSHQKRTMEIADCLYGVTMQPGGSSKVVSERLTSSG